MIPMCAAGPPNAVAPSLRNKSATWRRRRENEAVMQGGSNLPDVCLEGIQPANKRVGHTVEVARPETPCLGIHRLEVDGAAIVSLILGPAESPIEKTRRNPLERATSAPGECTGPHRRGGRRFRRRCWPTQLRTNSACRAKTRAARL